MKKFLSLVLALVMTMSLVTVASAAEYKDDSSIEYEEAVAVISGAGIVGGYADGSFNPKGHLTRQAAAKIICNLTLGATAADALGTTVAPYKDVPADSQFGGYIAYCAQMNYISGYADGTFRPNGTLTGFAFLKMLECALGYDQTIEGLVGTNWAVNVARLALEKDLIDGNDAFVGGNAITREEACLYALNALEAVNVKYDSKGTNITTTDGTVVNVGATPAEDVVPATTLADKCQKKLDIGAWANDEFNGPSRTITFDNVKIGTFSKKDDKVYTEKVEGKEIWADLALNSNVNDYLYAVDGAAFTAGILTKADETEFGDDGVMTYVYKVDNIAPFDGKADTVVICSQSLYTDKITSVGKNAAGERVVKIDGLEYVTEDFAKGDIVSYTKDDAQPAADKIQTMVALEKVTGKVTKMVGTGTFYIDGTKYTKADQGTVDGTVRVGDEVEYYLDAAGTIGYIKTIDSSVNAENLAYLMESGSYRGDYAVLRFSDGTKKTVDTDKDYSGYDMDTYIVKFSVNESGVYKLTATTSGKISAANTTYTNGTAALSGGVTNNVDSKTVFLYKVGDKFTQYVGKKNAPSFATASNVVAYTASGRDAATFVYVEVNGSISTDSSKLTVIAFKAGTKVTTDKDGLQYYEYKAIVDGEVGTVKVSDADRTYLYSYRNEEDLANAGFMALTACTVDSDGITSWGGENELALNANATIKVADDVVYINGAAKAYADDVVVYFVDNDDHSVSVGTIDDIVEDDNNADSSGMDDYGYIAYKMNSTNTKVTAIVIAINP